MQSLLEIIETLNPNLLEDITNSSDVSYLLSLKKIHFKDPDIITVIEARIENLNYLIT